MYVVKTDQSVYVQAWLCLVKGYSSITNVVGTKENVTVQQWITGRPPRAYYEYSKALEGLWSISDERVLPYASVLRPKQFDLDLYCERFKGFGYLAHVVSKKLKALPESEFTLVNVIHGDATFSNVVYTDSDVAALIDPGEHRGLCCKELDEAKMLQSYQGWDAYRHNLNWPVDVVSYDRNVSAPRNFVIRPVHILLLLTHYMRLMKHVHTKEAYKHARYVIDKLSETVEHAL